MRSYYVTVTRYRSVDGVIYRGVAPLDVRHLPVRPNQKEIAPPPKSCSNDLTGGWWFNDYHNSDLNGRFMRNTRAYSGVGWVRFKHNLSLKFVKKGDESSVLPERKRGWGGEMRQIFFAQIRETILSAFIKYFSQKIATRNCFVHKRKSYTVMPCSR